MSNITYRFIGDSIEFTDTAARKRYNKDQWMAMCEDDEAIEEAPDMVRRENKKCDPVE